MRVCYTCKEEKPLSEFYSGKCYKDNYDIYCKSCARERRRNNDRNPKGNRHKKRLATDNQFWCPKCKTYKDVSDFYIDNSKRSPSGYATYCKRCDNKRKDNDYYHNKNKEWYQKNVKENPEKLLLERERKLETWRRLKDTPVWRASKSRNGHKRRTRVKNSIVDITADDIEVLIRLQHNKCANCHREFSTKLNYELDHIKPLSKGGNLTLENVQLLCKSCNCSKGNKMIKYIDDFNIVSLEEVEHG